MTVNFGKNLRAKEDLLFGDSTTTVKQTRQLQSTQQAVDVTPIDSAVIPASTALKQAAGQPGADSLDDVVAPLFGAIVPATTTTPGIVKVDDDGGGDPVAVTTTGPAAQRIPTAAQSAGLSGTPNTPSATNHYTTLHDLIGAHTIYDPELGDGSDGVATIGAITGTLNAPTVSKQASGNITGTRFYRIAAGNLSGTTAASPPSAGVTLASENAVLDLPTSGLTNCQWIFVYASATAGGTYYEVGRVNYGTATFIDRLPALPSSGNAAPGSDTSGASSVTLSGVLNFSDMPDGCWGAGFTINIDSTGPFAGFLQINSQTQYNDENLTVTGTGTFRRAGYNDRSVCSAATNSLGTTATAPGNTVATARSATGGTGIGVKPFAPFVPGFGQRPASGQTDGTVTLADGGYAGGDFQFYAPKVAAGLLRGTYNLRGQKPAAATGSGNHGCPGSGGGAGGRFRGVINEPCAGTAVIDVRGGDGGDASSNGGTKTARGGAPGGGGIVELYGPNWVTSSMTIQTAAGSDGANATTSINDVAGGGGGAYAGNGGTAQPGGASTGASAGGVITAQNKYFRGKRMGVLA